MPYTYKGDRHTDPLYRGASCQAIRNQAGKCIRGKNGNMLVKFDNGNACVVVARLLRKLPSVIIASNDTELSTKTGRQVTIIEKG